MKKIFTFLFAIVATSTLWAHDFEVDGIYYNILSDTTVEVTYRGSQYDLYDEYSGAVTIPNTVTNSGKDYCVTKIGANAFKQCSTLTIVTIGNNVEIIGQSAFEGCSNLSSAGIPNSVKKIEWNSFSGCSALTSIKFPNSLEVIESAFDGCSALTSVTIPYSVKRISNGAFANCPNITSILVESSNSWYDSRNGCNAIIQTTDNVLVQGCQTTSIPNSISYIGPDAFRGCSNLTSITIPTSVMWIQERAFRGCSNLTSITIPNSVKGIKSGAFRECSSLTSFVIPSSITSIEEEVFMQCKNLTSVSIPNSVTSIGKYAFCSTALTSIIIPNCVTSIGFCAFLRCSFLTSIILPEGIDIIDDQTFENCSSLVSVTIPNSVITIDFGAFRSCTNLTSITFPSSIKSLNSNAFILCDNLDSVIVEATTPPSIGGAAFDSNPNCYVPCGTVEAYKASDWNQYCKAIIEPASEMQFNISVSDSTQGCIIIDQQPTCSNDTLIFHAEPIPSHYFVQWSDGNTDNPRTIILTQDTALAAEFAIKTCTLELSAEGNGTVTGAGTYNYGDTAIITARPEEHHHFVQWSDGNTDTLRTIVLTQDTSITARFAIDTYTLYLYTGENGIVTGAGTYNHGDTATITAIPNDGYYFTQWSDGNTDNPRTIIVTEDVFLSANFIIGGQCGDSLYWTYEQSTKQLTLLGTGDMYDYTVWTLPWQKYTHMIRSISLPEGMTTIGTSAFADCKYVHSIVIPSSVERIYDSAFENCRMLSEIQFGEDGVLTELGSWAFYNCHELKELAIPEGVTSIGYATFYGCTYLNELTLPATMEYIADNGFAYCAKLQKMTVNAITPPQVDARTFEDVDRSIPVYVPAESVDAYKAAPVWQEFNIQSKSTNVENTADTPSFDVQKLIRNGQVYILHEEKQYTISGQLVK